MALSPNGKIIASGGADGKVRLWDVETRKVIAKWTGHTNIVLALCWSADGERVASGSWDGMTRVWDVDSGKTDSSKLVTGGDGEDFVKIWDAKAGELLNTLKHDSIVRSLAWTSDGKKLISGSNGPIRIFDTATWEQIAILEGHTHFVHTISLSQNCRILASTSWDKTARIWNLDTNLQVGLPLHYERYLDSAVLSPDGKVLVTGGKNKNVYTWDIHSILKEAGLEDLLPICTNLKPGQDALGTQHTPRSSLSGKSFLEADATLCPGQFGSVDPTFFSGMEASVDSSSTDGAHPHSSINALLTHISSFLHRFQSENGEPTELPQPSRPSVFHPHVLFARLSSLFHHSPHTNDAPDEISQPFTTSRLYSHVLIARLSSLLHRSRLDAGREAEPHVAMPSSSRPDALFGRLSSLFRSQPNTNEEMELTQHPNRPCIVEVAAVRDKQALVVARGPKYEKARRAYEQQAQSHGQAQMSSPHTQPVDTSTSATPPAPGTTTTQSRPIPWWAHIVLLLCCASTSYTNGRQYS